MVMEISLPPDETTLTLKEFVARVDRGGYEMDDHEFFCKLPMILGSLAITKHF